MYTTVYRTIVGGFNMNKQEFMKRLKKALRWTFDSNEIEDILSDYKGFFEDGIKNGRSEQTVCKELGNPNGIAFDLATELCKTKRFSLSAKVMRRMVLVIVLLSISIVFYYLVNNNSVNIFWHSIISMVLFIIVLWFTLGGTIHGLPPVSPLKGRLHKGIVIINHILLLCVVTIFHIFLSLLIKEMFEDNVFINIDIQFIKNMWVLFMVIAFILAILSLYGFYRFTPQYFTIICHSIGVVAYLCSAYYIAKTLDSPEKIQSDVSSLLYVYAASVIITILFTWLIYVLQKRRI